MPFDVQNIPFIGEKRAFEHSDDFRAFMPFFVLFQYVLALNIVATRSENESPTLENESPTLEIDFLTLENESPTLEIECATLENESPILEIRSAMLEIERAILENRSAMLENDFPRSCVQTRNNRFCHRR